MDDFAKFVFDLKLRGTYDSPSNEASLYKGIPMKYRDSAAVRSLLTDGRRVRYRGPRHDRHNLATLKSDATHFSIYPK